MKYRTNYVADEEDGTVIDKVRISINGDELEELTNTEKLEYVFNPRSAHALKVIIEVRE